MTASQDVALFGVALGTGGILWELLRPGWIVPGVAGCALAAAGSYELWQRSPAPTAMLLLLLATILFVVEARWRTRRAAGVTGTAALLYAVCQLFPEPGALRLTLAIPEWLLLGVAIAFLADRTREARQRKANPDDELDPIGNRGDQRTDQCSR